MGEIILLVEEGPKGGFMARALGESIITDADDIEPIHRQVRDSVNCHFDEGASPDSSACNFYGKNSSHHESPRSVVGRVPRPGVVKTHRNTPPEGRRPTTGRQQIQGVILPLSVAT